MQFFLLSLVLFCFPAVSQTGGDGYCPQGMFQPQVDGPCRLCTICPEHQIVRETCDKSRDTLCGSFTEFKLFKSPVTDVESDDANSGDSWNQESIRHTHNIVTTEADDENSSWHTITMAMIALLCITGILFLLFVSLVCYRNSRLSKAGFITQVDKDSDCERPHRDTSARAYSPIATTSRDETKDVQRRDIEQFEIAVDSDNT